MKDIPEHLKDFLNEDGSFDEKRIAEIFGRFNVKYRKSPNQNGVWTANHVKYDVELYYDGEFIYKTEYQCPSDCVVKISDVWRCVLTDARFYNDSADMADFLEQGCYCGNAEEVRKGIAAYEGCKRSWEVITAKGLNVISASAFIDLVDDDGYDYEAEAEELE